MLKGVVAALWSLGAGAVVLEVARRLGLIRGYQCRGFYVDSAAKFRALRLLSNSVVVVGRYAVCRTGYGVLAVPKEEFHLLDIAREDHERVYGAVDVTGGVVMDIGAYIGDTAVFFSKKGARAVYAYEPVRRYYLYMLLNLVLNRVENAIPHNLGVWHARGRVRVEVCGAGSGVKCESESEEHVEIETATLEEVVSAVHGRHGEVTLVKMDCEGCEASILYTDDATLGKPENWIVETHTTSLAERVVRKLKKVGYKPKLLHKHGYCRVYLFQR